MSTVVGKIGKFLGLIKDTVTDEDIQKGIMFELTDQKSVLEADIEDLMYRMELNDENHESFSKMTSEKIEKGFKEGEELMVHTSERHDRVHNRLLNDLALKNGELVDVNLKLNVITKALDSEGNETGKGKKTYADAIIQNENNEILFLLRTSSDSFEPNTWGLPGGKVDPGETAKEGLVREVQEETGLTVTGCFPSHVKKYEMGESHYFHVFVKEDCSMISLDDEEHSNYAFMSMDEIEKREGFLMDLKDTVLAIMNPFGPIKKGLETLVKGSSEGDVIIPEMEVQKIYQAWYDKVKKD